MKEYEVEQFLEMLRDCSFWDAPFEDLDEEIGLDGATWGFEGVKNGNHTLLQRWSPDSGPFFYLGVYFLYLGEIEADPVY